MSNQIQQIISAIDKLLVNSNQSSIDANTANAMLDRLGLLKNSKDRPGKPLRDLLRKGLLPHAYQSGGKGSTWIIPKSKFRNHKAEKHTIEITSQNKLIPKQRKIIYANHSSAQIEKNLLNEKYSKKASTIDEIVPNVPGIYIVRINSNVTLPDAFRSHQIERGHNILYLGIATTSLKSRFLNQELRARGHGTFFRSIGAMLGYTPIKGSLITKANKRNYKFPVESEQEIISWINKNLIVHWSECEESLEDLETVLIGKYRPLLNIAKNPSALEILQALRRKCVEIANGK